MILREHRLVRRPVSRAVWAARITGTTLCALVVVGILLPVLGLIGAADAATIGALRVPVGAVVASIAISYWVALVLLIAAFVLKHAPLAWVAAVAAVVATLVGSVWPLVATAFASVQQVQDVVPFIQHLIEQVTTRTSGIPRS